MADKDGQPVVREPLRFLAPNHDDIFDIVLRMQQRGDMDEQTAQRFAVGLKLLTEPMMEHKNHPLFAELKPFILEIMNVIKHRG